MTAAVWGVCHKRGRTVHERGRYSTGMKSLLLGICRGVVPVAAVCVSGVVTASTALAQVATGDLSERPTPPIPKSPEQLMGGHGILMILLGVILLGLVVGACLIPVKRGHMD